MLTIIILIAIGNTAPFIAAFYILGRVSQLLNEVP